MRQNKGKEELHVQYDLEMTGLSSSKETPFTFNILSGEEKVILELTTSPGLSWSLKHKVGYRVVKKEIVVSTEIPEDPTIARIEEINKKSRTAEKEAILAKKEPIATPSMDSELDEPIKVESLVIYGKANCGRCDFVTKSLRNKKINYKEYNIEKNETRNKEVWLMLRDAGFDGNQIITPIVLLNGTLYYNIGDLIDFVDKLEK